MNRRPLTICAVGSAESVHVAARTRCFADLGHRVYLVTEREGPPIAGVEQFVPRPSARSIVSHAARAASFLAFLRRCKPDVVHVHYAYNYYGWLAGLLGCKPIAVTVMGGDVLFEEQGSPTPTGRWLTVHLLRQARYVTAKSDHLAGVLGRIGGIAGRVERVVWGIPLEHFRRTDPSALRERLGLRVGSRVILSPKILQPFYRVHLVVEAMPTIVAAMPEAVLLLTEYGADPAYRAQIDRRIHELGLGAHVRFCGRVAHEDMPQYYSAAEMTVAIPSSDGLPQTLLEGMACEAPSVLARLPRYEEVVTHRESAYFVDADPQSIAQGIVELMRDAGLRARIASKALAIVQAQADLHAQARLVEERFCELADEPRAIWRPVHLLRACAAYLQFICRPEPMRGRGP